jgi:hypothetical protein
MVLCPAGIHAGRAFSSEERRAKMRALSAQRIGMAGYARIIGSLRAGPLSSADLSAMHGVSHLLILLIMRHCLRAGIVHRVDWYRPKPHSRMVPRWALGADGDISMPQYEERTRRPRRAPSALITVTTALQLMSEHPHSRAELAAALCMHVETAARIVSALRAAKLIYVASWHKPPVGTPVQEFATGCRPDVPRPKRIGSSPRVFRQYRQRRLQIKAMMALAGKSAA